MQRQSKQANVPYLGPLFGVPSDSHQHLDFHCSFLKVRSVQGYQAFFIASATEMVSIQSPTEVASPENIANDSLKDIFEIHSNLVSSKDLLQVLESCLQDDSFTVEMRHSVYIIRVKESCIKEEKASLEGLASGL
ncbi:hypothetical protein LY78DRAFT_662841 [Colletotrichum sublineola]|nr:hypothetical protein LY78DRAFT_662841 [Colletotrichum sublineola]